MKDPNDTRDTGPRAGSPLWIFLTAVTILGFLALGVAMIRLTGIRLLIGHPLFWVIAALVVAGQIWPIVAPGRPGPRSPAASLTFSFAVMLYWGLPVALLLRAIAVLGVGAAQRRETHRTAFDAAQVALSMTAAWLTIAAVRAVASTPAMRSGFNDGSASPKASIPFRCAPSAPARATNSTRPSSNSAAPLSWTMGASALIRLISVRSSACASRSSTAATSAPASKAGRLAISGDGSPTMGVAR